MRSGAIDQHAIDEAARLYRERRAQGAHLPRMRAAGRPAARDEMPTWVRLVLTRAAFVALLLLFARAAGEQLVPRTGAWCRPAASFYYYVCASLAPIGTLRRLLDARGAEAVAGAVALLLAEAACVALVVPWFLCVPPVGDPWRA